MFFGYDGGLDVSGAGMAYLVSKAAGKTDMAHVAGGWCVWGTSDGNGGLCSLNRLVLDDAVRQGLVLVENDLRLFGRQSRALPQMLAYSSRARAAGTVRNHVSSAEFSRPTNRAEEFCGGWRSYVELDRATGEAHLSLYIHLLDNNSPEFIIQGMVGEVYTLVKEEFKAS